MIKMVEQDVTQELQNKVDRAKALAMISNVHNLSPPIQKQESEDKEIAIVQALQSKPRLAQLYFKARGLVYDNDKRAYVQIRKPYMNVEGAYLLVDCCALIAEEGEWSNFDHYYIFLKGLFFTQKPSCF